MEDPNGDGKGANEDEGEPRRITSVRGRMEVSKCKGLNLYMASRAKNPRASIRGGEDCFESLTIRWDCPQGVASVCWSGRGPCWRRRSSPFPSKHGAEGGVRFFLSNAMLFLVTPTWRGKVTSLFLGKGCFTEGSPTWQLAESGLMSSSSFEVP